MVHHACFYHLPLPTAPGHLHRPAGWTGGQLKTAVQWNHPQLRLWGGEAGVAKRLARVGLLDTKKGSTHIRLVVR